MPPPSQSPFVAQNHPPPPQNAPNFDDIFNANNSNWNWNPSASNATILNPLADTPSTLLETAPAQFATVGQAASDKYNARSGSDTSGIPVPLYDNHSQPDDSTNTQLPGARSAVSVSSGNQLTPQWSIESQVSQTSSDLSLDTRSSLTNTSEEHPYQQKFPPKQYPHSGPEVVQQQKPNEEVDLLEQTLHNLNVNAPASNAELVGSLETNNAASAQPYWQSQQSYQFNANAGDQHYLPNINEANEQTSFASEPSSNVISVDDRNNPAVQQSTPLSSFAVHTSTVSPSVNPPSFIPPTSIPPRSDASFTSIPTPEIATTFTTPRADSYDLQPHPSAVAPQEFISNALSSTSAPNRYPPTVTPAPPPSFNALSYTTPKSAFQQDTTDAFGQQQHTAAVAPPETFSNNLPTASAPINDPPILSSVRPPANTFMPAPSMPPRTQSPLVLAPSHAPPPSRSPFDVSSSSTVPQSNVSDVGLPPPTQFQIPPSQPQAPQTGASGNPFKRTGAALHKTLQFQNTPPLSAPMLVHQALQPPLLQPTPPTANDEDHLQPENSEVLSDVPHNDRNQYLQTGHLSEEPTLTAPESIQQSHQTDPNDYLPPPGLSRFVLGQPEVSVASVPLEPPPGLDRMVPGIDLSNSTQLNLERQADGQDTVTPPSALMRSANVGSFNNAPATTVAAHQEPLQNTDRNLYLVLGDESDSGQTASGQRVVDGRNTSDEPQQVSQQPLIGSSEQRELVMDGENLEDDAIRGRDEPLEGANLLDGPQQTIAVSEPVQHEAVQNTAAKKFNDGSLAGSTGNDESDRERTNYYNRTAPRRSDEPPRRREKPVADQRYDTEDTDYYSDRERERKRFGREGSVRRTLDNKERYDRDRDPGRHRGDASRNAPQSARSDKYRDDRGSRRGGDRYEKERYRYETDGSRYDPDDSRYNRQTRRRGEEDLDRQYRRGDRGLDGSRRG